MSATGNLIAPRVALMYFGVVGFILWEGFGHFNRYAPLWLALLLIGLVGTLVTAIRYPVSTNELERGAIADRLSPLLIAVCLIFFALTAYHDRLHAGPPFQTAFRTLSLSGAICMALLLVERVVRPLRHLRGFLIAVALLLPIIQRVLIPIAVPEAPIDVLVVDNLACDHLLAGRNPYPQSYPNVYEQAGMPHEHLAAPHVFYWPAYYLWAAPFRWAFGDVRFSHVASEAVTAALFIAIALELKWKLHQACLVAIAWLAHPMGMYVTEKAWIDPVMAMGSGIAALMFLKGRWGASAIASGFTVAVKQYGFIIPLFLLPALWKLRYPVVKFAALSAVTVAILLLPFAIPDFDAFLEPSREIFRVPPRADALSIYAFLLRFPGRIPVSIMTTGPTLLGLALSFAIAVRSNRRQPFLWMAGIIGAFGFMFLFGKQAFSNYYHLLSYFVLLWMLLCQAQIPAATNTSLSQK